VGERERENHQVFKGCEACVNMEYWIEGRKLEAFKRKLLGMGREPSTWEGKCLQKMEEKILIGES
jgi:hypothetical protein